MLDSFRRFTKTPIGKIVIAIPALGILAGFAMTDIRNFGSGDMGFGMGSSTLVEVGPGKVTETEMNDALERRLQAVRTQNPTATYADLMGEFDQILRAVTDQETLIAFADKVKFIVSKRLVDAEISQLPGTKGLNGKFSDAAYQQFLSQRRLTDTEIRELIKGGLLDRLMVTPVAASASLPIGMATSYASMLLEAREGEAAIIPSEIFAVTLKPTDADLQAFYAAQRGRYTTPEQRTLRIARIGPEQVASIVPSDSEIAAYYKANAATYAASDTRTISQVVVQDRAVAEAITKRAKAGGTLAAAASGNGASVSTLKDQTRSNYTDVAGKQGADQVFSAASGAIVGPIKTDFGWAVAHVDSVTSKGGKTLEQARGEIAAKLTTDKRRTAIEDLADKVQNAIDDGATFEEAVAAAKVPATTTPLVTAAGTSLTQAGFRMDAADAPILKTGFDIPSGDPPEVVALGDSGYAIVAPGEIVAAAPPPLAKIRDRVAADWIKVEALKRAKATAETIAAKVSKGMKLSDALRQANVPLPPPRPIAARRISLVSAQGKAPPALATLFALAPGKAKAVAESQGRGYGVVKVDKIVPGNATLQPGLVAQVRSELARTTSDAYAQQFVAAAAKMLGVKRNDAAINAMKKRLAEGNAS